MSYFSLIAKGIAVDPLLAEIDANPQLWDTRSGRRSGQSPHRETSDLWFRYADPTLVATMDQQKPHVSVWYPESDLLSSVHGIVARIREALGEPLQFGGVLATKIPAGKRVYEHHDDVAWHARYYTTKVWVVLRGNDQCINHVEDESMVWRPGEAWSHDNLLLHRVENRGSTERIVLILCFRKAANE